MHADIEQLLRIRDRKPVAAETCEHVKSCAPCSDELQRLEKLTLALRGLPPLTPPAGAWQGIAARLERPRRRGVAAAAAAAVLVLAAVVIWQLRPATPPGSLAPVAGVTTERVPPPATGTALADLLNESQRLEQVLRALDRDAPRVMSARTAGAIAGLEDSIALIDYGLTRDDDTDAGASQALWNRRVALMNTLVQVRGAQMHQALD